MCPPLHCCAQGKEKVIRCPFKLKFLVKLVMLNWMYLYKICRNRTQFNLCAQRCMQPLQQLLQLCVACSVAEQVGPWVIAVHDCSLINSSKKNYLRSSTFATLLVKIFFSRLSFLISSLRRRISSMR